MFWLVLTLPLIALMIYLFKDEQGGAGAFIMLLIITSGCVFIFSKIDSYKVKEKILTAQTIIDNKKAKIEDMKDTFFVQPSNTTINIDLVNQELAKSINDEIIDLERYINNINSEIVAWRINYRYRFWTATYANPDGIKLIRYTKSKD